MHLLRTMSQCYFHALRRPSRCLYERNAFIRLLLSPVTTLQTPDATDTDWTKVCDDTIAKPTEIIDPRNIFFKEIPAQSKSILISTGSFLKFVAEHSRQKIAKKFDQLWALQKYNDEINKEVYYVLKSRVGKVWFSLFIIVRLEHGSHYRHLWATSETTCSTVLPTSTYNMVKQTTPALRPGYTKCSQPMARESQAARRYLVFVVILCHYLSWNGVTWYKKTRCFYLGLPGPAHVSSCSPTSRTHLIDMHLGDACKSQQELNMILKVCWSKSSGSNRLVTTDFVEETYWVIFEPWR